MAFYTLYLDASGGKGWPWPYGKDEHKYYVLAGLALPMEQEGLAQYGVSTILQKYLGPPTKGLKKYELHYNALMRGYAPYYDELDDDLKLPMADAIFRLIDELEPILFATVIDKAKHKRKYGDRAYPVTSLSLRDTMMRFDWTLQTLGNSTGQVIMDSEALKTDKHLQVMIYGFRHTGAAIRGENYQPLEDTYFERIINTTMFAPSETSPGIQLSDFIAYATWVNFERNKNRRYSEIRHLFYSRDGKQIEPAVTPK